MSVQTRLALLLAVVGPAYVAPSLAHATQPCRISVTLANQAGMADVVLVGRQRGERTFVQAARLEGVAGNLSSLAAATNQTSAS